MKAVFLFIDGLGIREPAADNPVNPEVCPALWRLIDRHSRPIDACLGVGSIKRGLINIRDSFKEAQEAINLGLTQQNKGRVFFFQRLS